MRFVLVLSCQSVKYLNHDNAHVCYLYVYDMLRLKPVWRFTRLVNGTKDLSYPDRLKKLNLAYSWIQAT